MPPSTAAPGTMITVTVLLRAPPLTPPAPCEEGEEEGEADESDAEVRGGPGRAKKRRWEVEDRAQAARLRYDSQPNPLNPAVAWPLLELGDFSNMRPEYFNLPERGRLFKSRFCFKCWADARAFFDISFSELAGPRPKMDSHSHQ